MTDAQQLPFGLAADGRMMPVSDVARGLACGCVCPECRSPLIACKGNVNVHHFRHHAETSQCHTARETALHLYAKQVICAELKVMLPDYEDISFKRPFTATELVIMRAARAEVWMDGIKPDVLAEYDAEHVAIEIYVAHRVPDEKIAEITRRDLACVEIDLSAHRHRTLSTEQWRDIILNTAPRMWLHPPKCIRDAVRAAQEERKRWQAQQRLLREAAERREREAWEALAPERKRQADEREREWKAREQQRLQIEREWMAREQERLERESKENEERAQKYKELRERAEKQRAEQEHTRAEQLENQATERWHDLSIRRPKHTRSLFAAVGMVERE